MSRAKTAHPVEMPMPFGLRSQVGPMNHVLDGSPDRPMARGSFREKDIMAEPIDVPFGLWSRVGQMKHVLCRVHTGATRQIPLNHLCVVAMRPVVKLL